MRSKMKNKSLCVLTAAAALCLGGAVAGLGLNTATAYADEEGVSYYAFVNVGANDDAKVIDTAMGLTEKGTPTVTGEGTVVEGSTLFESYSTGKTYSFTLDESKEYQVAVAVVAESGTAVTVNSAPVDLKGAEGKCIASTTVEGTSITVSVTGKLCAILVAEKDSKILMSAEYTAGQVISYGALLEEVLDKATGYYSNGEIDDAEIEYDVSASVGTGVNTLFYTSNVTGTVKGTSLSVSRYVITMPDDLVYFINCGSYNVDNKYKEGGGIDPYYSYNKTVFDYYKAKGSALKNDGVPDKQVSQNGSEGAGHYYTYSIWSAPESLSALSFPYNTLLWNDKNDTKMGYVLTGLDSGNYRIYIGSASAWHGRNVDITFNGAVVGSGNLSIKSTKGYAVFENVPASSGKIDINMVGGSTNEPCINFIAVQKMSTEVSAVPTAPEGPSTIGMADHSLVLTGGVQEGAKIQLYNAARPNQVLYEEKVNAEKIVSGEDGSQTYELDWGELFDGIAQFYIVQITNGGVSEAHRVSITDIEDFGITLSTQEYTTGTVTVHVTAHANSGIAAWSYQLGEYGAASEFTLDRPATMNESFTVSENGTYKIKVTSGLGVFDDKTVIIGNIDPARPVITVTPSRAGWVSGAYNVSLSVKGISPVAEYKLYKDGKEIASSETAPATVKFTEAGEYLIYVKNEAGQSATSTLCVSEKPTVTRVASAYANRTLTFTFEDTAHYTIASVTAYRITESRVTRMTIGSGNTMDVYDAGTYVVTVTTTNGTVEMFSFDVTEDNLSNKKTPEISAGKPSKKGSAGSSNSVNGAALGIGLGVGIGGVAIAAAAITVTLVLMKKKKA